MEEEPKDFNRRAQHEALEGKEIVEEFGSDAVKDGGLKRLRQTRKSPKCMPCKRPSIHTATTAEDKIEGQSSQATDAEDRQRGVVIEIARTNRSSCRYCQLPIEEDAVRCGVEVNSGSKCKVRWCHAQCFLSNCTHFVRHPTSHRSNCRGSGKPIAKGDLVVRFSVGDASSNWLPEPASRVIGGLVKLVGSEAAGQWIRSSGSKANPHPGDLPYEDVPDLINQLLRT
eukprot:CAMPEP_0172811030 /NCGR_PEP_ID=MMETSP1075-20121228/9166_1 /TAXON_ID=2916 /ORGANISM="Ceratium fusus, Strain PA161109" /LENGTH=226 /DNA_ID=CAMNT_0013650415 /DNA_START=86 /DNA_END=766 /DNA_ORIENTATION=-